MERLLGEYWSRRGGPSVVEGILISGKETSRTGWKPSEELALQSTLMKFLKSLGLAAETSGAWKYCGKHTEES